MVEDLSKVAKLSPLVLEDEDEVPSPALPLPSNYEELDVSLDQFPRPHTRTTTQASDRLTHLHHRTQAKIKRLREHKEMQMREQCTFTPKLRSVSPPRSFKDFYTCQVAYEKSRKDRIAHMKDEKTVQQEVQDLATLHSPTISAGSRNILKDKHTLTLIQRLNIPKKPVPPPKPPTSPKMSPKQVQQTVERLHKTPMSPPVKAPDLPSFRSVLTPTSVHLHNSALLREISTFWLFLRLEDSINYRQFQYLLSEMGYITGNEQELVYFAWRDINKGEEFAKKEDVERFLVGIEGEKLSKISTEDTETTEKEDFPVNLRTKYQVFIGNRMIYRKKREISGPEFAFKPELSANSEEIMQKLRGSASKTEFKRHLSEKRLENKKKGAEETLQDMMKDCTFQPKITKKREKSAKKEEKQETWDERLYKKDETWKYEEKVDYEYERNKAELTFRPKINSAPRLSPRSASPDVSKAVTRMRSAYLEASRLRHLQERGVPLSPTRQFSPRKQRSHLEPVLGRKPQVREQSIDLMEVLGVDSSEAESP